MNYTMTELLFFLLFYSFAGWCIEVAYMAIRTGTFCNRGFFSLPLCLSYGITMDLLLLLLPTMRGHYILQLAACTIITSAAAQLASEISVRLTGASLWDQELLSPFSGKLHGLLFGFLQSFLLSGTAVILILLIQPLLYIGLHMVPRLLLYIVTYTLLAFLAADFAAIHYAIKRTPVPERMQNLTEGLQERKLDFGSRLTAHIWRRLKKAYPKLQPAEGKLQNGQTGQSAGVFAKGICLDKLLWVFFISALGGDLIETLYVHLTAGIWMSRSSVLYGTFSIVWGIGAALLTLLLHRLADREDRYIFLGGFFLGGTYEYLCSVFTEVFFGTTFWDYSNMPFNIGGRTNLLFCLFWGILSLVWLKLCYPPLSRLIERLPLMAGKILTWLCVILMTCDMLISAFAMVRYVKRADGVPAETRIDGFLDYQYPDELIEFVWPNLRITADSVSD